MQTTKLSFSLLNLIQSFQLLLLTSTTTFTTSYLSGLHYASYDIPVLAGTETKDRLSGAFEDKHKNKKTFLFQC